MKQTKRIIALLLMTMLVAGAVMMNGCSLQKKPSRVDTAKAALADKYGEEFNVRIDESYSSVFYATCSPVNNPEVLFEARFSEGSGVTILDQDDYYDSYTASLINEIFEKDLQKFFPGAYFRTHGSIFRVVEERFADIRNHPLEELLDGTPEGYAGEMYLDIYVDASVGTTKQYEEEYIYFTRTVDKYVEENKMLPITVCIVKLDTATLAQVKEYFKEEVRIYDYEGLLGGRLDGVDGTEATDAGTPPSMAACFKKDKIMIENVEEYIRRREIWEDAK